MSGNSHPVIELGLELLKEGCIEPEKLDPYSDAFSLLDIDIKAGLKLAGLRSIFSDPSDSRIAVRYYTPCELDPVRINYPDQEVDPCNFSKVKPSDKASQNALVQLERCGSFVATSADQQTPVFDLFKSVAAVYDCLTDKDADTEKKCLLVGCDFSGIQDTVYTISSKGALKTLRARSFMLELLTEHIIYEILTMAKAGRHAIIYSGGGGFALLLPNKDRLKGKIEEFGGVLNEWAYSEFFGKLFIAMDVLPFKAESLKPEKAFQTLRQEQSDNLDKQKRRKFLKQLDKLFEPKMPEQTSVQTECQITRRDDLNEYNMRDLESGTLMADVTQEKRGDGNWTWVSESSYRQFRLGDKLLDAKYVCRRKEAKDHKSGFLVFPKAGSTSDNLLFAYYVASDRHIKNSDFAWYINQWQCNENEFLILYGNYVRNVNDLPASVQPRAYERYLEEHGKEMKRPKQTTANFEDLSECSCGADLIGALRMDVDNMGDMFGRIEKLSKLSAKSRMLNLFFKVYLNEICRANLSGEPVKLKATDIVKKKYAENKGRNVSVIYAGGDDLFILGAWDETAELAFDIQRCFAHFTGGSLDKEKQTVTGGRGISGGLTLHQPKFPLYQMARKSGEAEHVAKQAKVQKNCFTPFLLGLDDQDKTYEFYNNKTIRVIDWNDAIFFDLLKNLVALTDKQFVGNQIDAVKLEGVSRGFIYKLFETAKVWVIEDSLYLPRLRYIFARLEKQYDEHKNEEIQKLQRLLFSPVKPEREKSIKLLNLILNWFEQLQRSK